jgi:uncharacterized protein YidB (DUF937 family)
MGLLDIVGQVLGGQQGTGNNSPGFANVLANLLANQGQANQGQANQVQRGGGGLGGLIDQFRSAGLGHVADSWVRSGPNQSVSPQQLQSVFGDQQVDAMSREAGMPRQDFLSQLSQHLPRVVDSMTPEGQMPDEGTVSV